MRFFVLALLGLVVALPVTATWVEPPVPGPGGDLGVPVLSESDQTKAGSLELAGGASVLGPSAANAQQRSALRGIGSYRTTGTVSAGIHGLASDTAAPAAADPKPVQVGVYGAAGVNSGNAVGVYGDAAGFATAWAGYFQGGSTGFAGALTLSGANGNLTATSGASVTSDAGAAAVTATTVTSGTSGVYGLSTVDGSPGGEGFGVLGTLDGGIPNCVSANCSAVLGADTDAYSLRSGRFAGYFVGNVHITERLYLNGRLTAPPVSSLDYDLFSVPNLAAQQPGALLGLETQTGTANDATGGVTSTGDFLIVTDYLGVDTDIARVNPVTLKPDSAADIVALANPAQQVTYDGQNVWVRSNATLRKLHGQTFAELGNWTYTIGGFPTTLYQPYFSGQGVFIGANRANDTSNWMAYSGANGTVTAYFNGVGGCAPVKHMVRVGSLGGGESKLWMATPSACSLPPPNTSLAYFLMDGVGETSGGPVYTNALGPNGRAVGIAYDGTDLWLSTENNFYPSGDVNNHEVHLLRINPAAPTTILTNLTLPNTVGYNSGPVVFDGAAVWVSASTFGTNGFGYDGKLFRIPVATGVPAEIDRSTTAVGNSPIQDLYFDGSELFLYGYHPGAAPRINYYLEKRSR